MTKQSGRRAPSTRRRPALPRDDRPRTSKPRKPQAEPPVKAGTTRMFATAIPGMAPLVVKELNGLPGLAVQDSGFDGRSDVIVFEAARGARSAALELGITEDVFVEVGRTQRSEGDKAGWIAGRIWRPERVQRALSVWAEEVRPLSGSMTFRVIARVLQERSFMRTELRRQLTDAIGRDRPKWRFGDPAQIEIWISEYSAGRFVAGLRLSDANMRQHEGRVAEREGALRPTVAAAMVRLAGEPEGLMLDPCCGSGTILAEAQAAGWKAVGSDLDPNAVHIARQNAVDADVSVADARKLTFADESIGACVSNLPYGQQYSVQGEMDDWLRAVTAEMARVTVTGGRIVLLAPELPRTVLPAGVQVRERYAIRLLGTKTTIWLCEKAR